MFDIDFISKQNFFHKDIKDKLYSDIEEQNYNLYYNHRNILDNLFKEILVDSDIKEVLKYKKVLSDVLTIIDETELMTLLIERKTSSCISEKCNNFFNVFSLLDTSEGIAKRLIRELPSEKEFNKKCCLCQDIKYILGCAFFQSNQYLEGCFCSDINDMIYVKKSLFFGFYELSVYIHEYIHYLVLKKDIENEKWFLFFNEGITQVLTNYFLNEYFRRMLNSNNFFVTKKTGRKLLVTEENVIKYGTIAIEKYNRYKKKNRPLYVFPSNTVIKHVKYSVFKNHYFSFLKDIHTLKRMSEKQINFLSYDFGLSHKTYLYNMFLVYYIMRDIGVFKVIKTFFLNDFNSFLFLLKEKYGELKINNLLNILNNHIATTKYTKSEISFEEFKQIINILEINLNIEKLKEKDEDF